MPQSRPSHAPRSVTSSYLPPLPSTSTILDSMRLGRKLLHQTHNDNFSQSSASACTDARRDHVGSTRLFNSRRACASLCEPVRACDSLWADVEGDGSSFIHKNASYVTLIVGQRSVERMEGIFAMESCSACGHAWINHTAEPTEAQRMSKLRAGCESTGCGGFHSPSAQEEYTTRCACGAMHRSHDLPSSLTESHGTQAIGQTVAAGPFGNQLLSATNCDRNCCRFSSRLLAGISEALQGQPLDVYRSNAAGHGSGIRRS